MIPVSLSSADDQGLQLQLKSGSQLTRRWREADSNCESLSEIVPLAPGQMIGKSRADGGKILEQLGSWGGILSASIGMPMVASQR